MKRRVTVEELSTRIIRGEEILVGRAEVVEKNGNVMTVEFSRREGEKFWTADAVYSGKMPLFRSPTGSRRSGTARILSGWVAEAVDKALDRLLEGTGSCCSQRSTTSGSAGSSEASS